MKSISGYFPGGAAQEAWGLRVTCAGIGRSEPGAEFPARGHPDGYYFSWERGRVLDEWQLILIEDGRGEAEFGGRRIALAQGVLLALAPGCRHRYRPDPETGWATRWIGFGGDIASRLAACAGFGPDGGVRDIASSRHLRDCFAGAVKTALECGRGRPRAASAALFSLLAELAEAPPDERGAAQARREEAMREAKAFIADNCDGIVDFKALAKRLGMTYRTFRYLFARECGMPPLRYQQETRLARAKSILASSDMPIAEIASSIGFSSAWNFAHFFQRETGRSAMQYRKQSPT